MGRGRRNCSRNSHTYFEADWNWPHFGHSCIGLLGLLGVAIGIGVLVGAVIVAETGFSPAAQVWVLARNPGLWTWTAVAGVVMWRRLRLLFPR